MLSMFNLTALLFAFWTGFSLTKRAVLFWGRQETWLGKNNLA